MGEAMTIAREFIESYPGLVAGSLGPDISSGPPVQVNPALLLCVQNRLCETDGFASNYSVRIRQKDEPLKAFSSYLVRKRVAGVEHRAIITLTRDMNHCYTRYSTTKELAHLIADQQPTYCDEPIELLEWAIENRDEFDLTTELHAEAFCYFVALEILLPWKYRKIVHQMEERQTYGEDTRLEIADLFKVPEKMIRRYFETGYCALSWKFNSNY